MNRKSLSDILREGDRQNLSRAWGETQAAEDFSPLPSGEYVARIIGGELFTSKTRSTAGYKLAFRVLEGDHQGRQFWHDVWLTPAALPMAKRDLAKLGVTALEQLERPLPPGIRCRVKLALRKDDDGTEYNRVRSFEVIGIDEPEQDAFARKMAPGRHRNPEPPTDRQGVPMTASDFRFGFWIVGACSEPRRLVDAGAAFAAYAACDPRAKCHREAYLSAFRFAADFADQLKATGSTADFSGPCWSPRLWWDIDAEELPYAHKDAGALAAFLVERYGIDPGKLLLFFSGSKGFHLDLPTCLWSPPPSADFHRTARRFAEAVAEQAAVTIDRGVYDKVRAFAPNSWHPKTGLHKRRLTFDELLGPLDVILELAKTPTPFTVPAPIGTSETAAADWQAAAVVVASEAEVKAARRAAGNGSPTLNKATLEFIREGAGAGDRHRLLFSAAANLAEFGCTPALAVALLEESALDSGLKPKDVRRQIECGLAAVPSPVLPASTQQAAAESTQTAPDGSIVKKPSEAATSDSGRSEGQSCQQVTGATEPAGTVQSMVAADLQSALAKLWQSTPTPTPAPKTDQGEAVTQGPALDVRSSPAVLPPLPSALVPLPPGAVGSGVLDKPCRCGSTEYAELPISEGRTRRDCRKCGRFVSFGKWYDQGGIG